MSPRHQAAAYGLASLAIAAWIGVAIGLSL